MSGSIGPHQYGALQFCRRQFSLDLSQHDTKDRALAFNGFAHATKLLGMGITACFAAQFLAFLSIALLQVDVASFGRLYDFAARNFQQATIHRMRDRFFLYCRIDDDTFEFSRFDRLHLHGSVNCCFQKLFNTGFTNGSAEATYLSSITGQLRCVVRLSTEILPDHILRPANHQFLITEVECVFQIQQRSHQPNRQTRPSCSTHAPASNHQRCIEQMIDLHHLALTVLALKSGRKRCFDLRPRQSICQHRQGMVQINHLI